ncbi:MAG: ribosome small subunit-dependent GTPase A [Bacilli bacterium]|nr:ribosome small subunit-dependent GTPase A [Bacilli bacterium]
MRGLITCLKSGDYMVLDLGTKKTMLAKASGLFRHHGEKPKVGDYVEYQLMNDTTAYITKLEKRHNDLVRPAICNIDQAFVVFSVKEPDFNTNLLDRFLTILNFNNIEAILIFTKWDLLKEDEVEEVAKYQEYYQKIGYRVLTVSKNDKFDDFKKQVISLLENKITVITGQSGVGKSTILNLLDENLNLDVNEISYALGRGKHTTRHVELYPLYDGMLADTPGFGIMDFSGMEAIDIAQSFKEFFELSDTCKYKGCLHINEPACAVKHALDNDEIIKSRYDNYLLFIEENKKQRKW